MNGINNVSSAAAIRMLQDMQAMAGEASNTPGVGTGGPDGANFGDAMRNALQTVNSLQQSAAAQADAFASGENIPLTEVMVSMQKSRVAFEATKQVRNQLVEAYRDIFNMPV